MLTPILFCLVSAAYWCLGSWPDWTTYIKKQTRQQQAQVMLQSVRNPQELINKLIVRLKQEPDSARGWYLLGRLYASQNQWQQASNAYANAYRLKPTSVQTEINYAQSLWQLNHQTFDAKSRALFQSVLLKNENQPDALAMLAIDSFIGHAYQQAIDYWQRLLKIAPPQSEEAQAIRKSIARAHQKMA